MSYYASLDFEETAVELLRKIGYVVLQGNGYTSGEPGAELKLSDEYAPDLDGFWFTWSTEGCDIEVGQTFNTETAAWASALEHHIDYFLEKTK